MLNSLHCPQCLLSAQFSHLWAEKHFLPAQLILKMTMWFNLNPYPIFRCFSHCCRGCLPFQLYSPNSTLQITACILSFKTCVQVVIVMPSHFCFYTVTYWLKHSLKITKTQIQYMTLTKKSKTKFL